METSRYSDILLSCDCGRAEYCHGSLRLHLTENSARHRAQERLLGQNCVSDYPSSRSPHPPLLFASLSHPSTNTSLIQRCPKHCPLSWRLPVLLPRIIPMSPACAVPVTQTRSLSLSLFVASPMVEPRLAQCQIYCQRNALFTNDHSKTPTRNETSSSAVCYL